MKVFILPKYAFDGYMRKHGISDTNVNSQSKTIFISINGTEDTGEYPYLKEASNVKVLFFDDVEEDHYKEMDGKTLIAKAFTEDQGRELIEFLDRNKDKESCIVHCAAGISRSGAVGTFVNDYFRGDYKEFKKNNRHILPNGQVLRILNKLAR